MNWCIPGAHQHHIDHHTTTRTPTTTSRRKPGYIPDRIAKITYEGILRAQLDQISEPQVPFKLFRLQGLLSLWAGQLRKWPATSISATKGGKRMCGQVRLTKMEDSISQKKKDQDSVAEASWNYQWRVRLLSFSSFWKLAFCLWSCNNCILYMGVNVICSKIRETELDGKIGRPALNILKCRYLICQPNRLHTNHRSLVVD